MDLDGSTVQGSEWWFWLFPMPAVKAQCTRLQRDDIVPHPIGIAGKPQGLFLWIKNQPMNWLGKKIRSLCGNIWYLLTWKTDASMPHPMCSSWVHSAWPFFAICSLKGLVCSYASSLSVTCCLCQCRCPKALGLAETSGSGEGLQVEVDRRHGVEKLGWVLYHHVNWGGCLGCPSLNEYLLVALQPICVSSKNL